MSNTSSLQDNFNNLSIKDKEKKEQTLKNSTYNILEAYNDNIPMDFSLILDCQSIHPLQSSNPYNFDLAPKSTVVIHDDSSSDINELIETLDLNDTTRSARNSSSMPYCA